MPEGWAVLTVKELANIMEKPAVNMQPMQAKNPYNTRLKHIQTNIDSQYSKLILTVSAYLIEKLLFDNISDTQKGAIV